MGTAGSGGSSGTSGTMGTAGSGGSSGTSGTSGTSGSGFTSISPTTNGLILTANGTANTATAMTGVSISGTTITAGAFTESSDIRFKNIIQLNPITNLRAIDVIKFTRIDSNQDKIRYGYSAQQLLEIFPDVVNFDNEKYSVNYSDVHTLKIADLEKRIVDLENRINILEAK